MPETRLIPIYNLRLERRGSIRYASRDVSTPAAAGSLARQIVVEEFPTYAAEQLVTLYRNMTNRAMAYRVISMGTLSATLVHPHKIVKRAQLTNAHVFGVAHKPSSGDPAPSREPAESSMITLSNFQAYMGYLSDKRSRLWRCGNE